jgi:hypothetical protein
MFHEVYGINIKILLIEETKRFNAQNDFKVDDVLGF